MRLLLIAMLLVLGVLPGVAGADCMDSVWVIGPGSLNSDFGTSVTLAPDGNVVIGGYYDQLGITQGYGWLIKLNPADGNQLWSRTYSVGDAQSIFLDVAPVGGGEFICGGWYRVPVTNDQQFWLLRVAENGDSVWSHTFGHEFADQARAVIQAADGGFVIAGRATSFPGGFGGYDWWVVKTDANGDSLWSQIVGGPLEDTCLDMILTPDGNYLLSGYSLTDSTRDGRVAEISSTGEMVWTRTYSPEVSVQLEAAINADVGYLLCGTVNPPNGTNDVLLMQIDDSGNELWHRTFNLLVDRNDIATAIRSDGAGGYYLFGYGNRNSTTETDGFVMHVSSCGDSLSTVWVGNAVSEEIMDGELTPGGILVTAGVARLPGNQNELQAFGISADTCNARPCHFERVLPVDSSLLTFMTPLTFNWERAIDPDGGPVNYAFHLESNYAGGFGPADTVTVDTFVLVYVVVPVEPLDEVFDFHWRVAAMDGQDSVEATNGEGYFQMDIPQTASENVLAPSSFQISVFPNPFNPSTAITYDLPQASHVLLRVFDLLGREVAVLRDGFVEAGSHRVTFDASSVAAGIYFARLDAKAYSQTRKLMLLK